MSTYTYTEVDFTNASLVIITELRQIIENSSIATNLDYITKLVDESSFTIDIIFDATLSGGDETTLDGIVDAYTTGIDPAEYDVADVSVNINFIKDIKSNGTNGGTFDVSNTANSDSDENKDANNNITWQTRDLNTVEGLNVFTTLSNNEFTLQAGIYMIKASAPAFRVRAHQIRLYNLTDAQLEDIGSSEYSYNNNIQNRSFLSTFVSLMKATTFEIQHRGQTKRNNDGLGRPTGFGNNEIFTIVEIQKFS